MHLLDNDDDDDNESDDDDDKVATHQWMVWQGCTQAFLWVHYWTEWLWLFPGDKGLLMAWVGQTTGDNKFWILQRIFRGIEVQLRQTVPTDEIDRQVS